MSTALLLAAQIALAPCAIDGVPGPARCGFHRVWEDREARAGRQVDLSVIVLDALGKDRQPDPLFVIAGGPGDAPSFNARFFSRAFEQVRQSRDIVLVDLRGTGKSQPLTCPELAQPDPSGVLDDELLGVRAVTSCRLRLGRLADLRYYTTDIAVDDLDEVRQVLGYRQINLYGTSYGTRVAQVYMRRHPASVRTVSMKGVVPPTLASPSTHARTGEAAWQQLVKRCRTDPQCARSYPTLDDDFRTVLRRFKDAPQISLPAAPSGASKLRVSSGLFAESFRFSLYTPEALAAAPKLVRDLLSQKADVAETALNTRLLLGGDRLAAGFFLSVSCTEDVPYLPANVASLVAGSFGGDYRLRQQMQACREWPRGEVSAQHRQLTRSAIPALLLSGEFDPATPPAGGDEVLRGLTNGAHVVIRNNGHPIGSAEPCIGGMIAAFIDKASVAGLDQSCASAAPAVPFVLP